MLRIWPSALASILDVSGVAELDFTHALRACASSQLTLSIVIPAAATALGIYLLRSTRAAHKMTLGIAAGMGLIAIATNAIIIPAIANTLSLKAFTAEVLKTVDDHPLGYLLDMDYDIAFYSRRTFPIVLFKHANKPAYLLCWESIWAQRPAGMLADYQIIMTSNPTELDGSGRLLLLKKATAPANPRASDVSV
jgi:hypothetical protein